MPGCFRLRSARSGCIWLLGQVSPDDPGLYPHRFRHHVSHTWLDRGGPEGNLMELNGWSSPQMLARYGASARSARARCTYDRIMENTP
jgi:integrase